MKFSAIFSFATLAATAIAAPYNAVRAAPASVDDLIGAFQAQQPDVESKSSQISMSSHTHLHRIS